MTDEEILWDDEVLNVLCRATGYKKDVLKQCVMELAKGLRLELPHKQAS